MDGRHAWDSVHGWAPLYIWMGRSIYGWAPLYIWMGGGRGAHLQIADEAYGDEQDRGGVDELRPAHPRLLPLLVCRRVAGGGEGLVKGAEAEDSAAED